MEEHVLKERIKEIIKSSVTDGDSGHSMGTIWRTPLVGFADVDHEYIRDLPFTVLPTHRLPEDFLVAPTIIVSYFIPFTKALAATNVGVPEDLASSEWSEAYGLTNARIAATNERLAAAIRELGYHAAVPDDIGVLPDSLMSNWSQRHIAYAAGLGTFGLNNLLITAAGSCGRYGSIVTDLPLVPGQPQAQERCYYKRNGTCRKCIRNCPSGALTTDGFDRRQCLATCSRNIHLHGHTVCGKCAVDVPCAFL